MSPAKYTRRLLPTITHLGHVHVVHEVDEAPVARRSKVPAGLLLQRFLQNALQHLRGGVEVEGHVAHHEVVGEAGELVLHQHCLARAGVAHQHHGASLLDQHVEEVADTGRLGCVHQRRLETDQPRGTLG